MTDVDYHLVILAASENLDKNIQRLKEKAFGMSMEDADKVTLAICIGGVEGVADYLREKAEVIAETQP